MDRAKRVKSMALAAAGVALLLLSHGLAWWWGMAAGEGGDRSSEAGDRSSDEEDGSPTASDSSADSKLTRHRQAMIGELKRRALERLETDSRKAGQLEYQEANWGKVVAAEREKIPA